MKGRLLIVFYSGHGYVQRYVDILGNALGCDAVPAGRLKGNMLSDYDKILYIGSVKNGEINGLKKFSDYFEAIYKKLLICGVGMLPYRSDRPRRLKELSVTVMYEKFIPVFYVQGGFDLEELSRFEKFSLAFRMRQIKMASVLDDDDNFFIKAMNTPLDEVKLENIQPLIDYLEGREVDKSLYSPPEITDPEEEEIFFEEMKKAAEEPLNKKRALKKKLKKSFGKSVPPPEPAEQGQPPAAEPASEEPEQPAESAEPIEEQPEPAEKPAQ